MKKMEPTIIENPFLLVAAPYISEPNFRYSVVLIVEHTNAGSLGVFINRPSVFSSNNISYINEFGVEESIEVGGIPLWQGGINSIGSPFVIYSQDFKKSENSNKLITKLCCTFQLSEIPFIKEMATVKQMSFFKNRSKSLDKKIFSSSSKSPKGMVYPYRVMIGANIWGRGELDYQMRQGMWIQKPMDFSLIFNTPWDKVWVQSIQGISKDPVDIVSNPQYYII